MQLAFYILHLKMKISDKMISIVKKKIVGDVIAPEGSFRLMFKQVFLKRR